jgi:hypothetical protein
VCLTVVVRTGPGDDGSASTLGRHAWIEFVNECVAKECRRKREQSVAVEWRLLAEGYQVGEGHIGMVRVPGPLLYLPVSSPFSRPHEA